MRVRLLQHTIEDTDVHLASPVDSTVPVPKKWGGEKLHPGHSFTSSFTLDQAPRTPFVE